MSSPIASIDVGSTLREASEEMVRNDIGVVLVSEGARTGLISERDIVNVLGARDGVATIRVDQAVTWDLVWAAPDDPIVGASGRQNMAVQPSDHSETELGMGVRCAASGTFGRLVGTLGRSRGIRNGRL